MNWLRYANQFNALENEKFFSDSARGLFHRILYHFNKSRQWEASLPVNVPMLQLLTGSAEGTVRKGLAELQARGVIHYIEAKRGRGNVGQLRLLKVYRIKPPIEEIKPSDFDGLTDGFSEGFNYVGPVKPSTKPSDKPSNFDDTIREVKVVKDVLTGGAGPEKKRGSDEVENPTASASHTRARNDVDTSEGRQVPLPLAEGETLRGGFVDERLADSDPRKWEARPQSVAMVDAYLAGHPDPEISKHAGRGKLFFDYYDQFNWCTKGGRPITNWRATARAFSYIDYKADREAEQAVKVAKSTGGQLGARSVGIDAARAKLRAQNSGGQSDG
jgi:hypothetical protein